MDDIMLHGVSALLAFIPAVIWLSFIFTKTKSKKTQIIIFALSIFSVVPIFLLQYFLQLFPQLDVVHLVETQTQNKNIPLVLTFIGVGIVEEIVKQAIIRSIDKRYLLIETINESIQFSLIAALGFSFAENIFYFYHIWVHLGLKELFIAYLVRSIFTTCAHLVFSGFFGYYYGLAKFSLEIREQSHWMGKKLVLSNLLASIFNISKSEALKHLLILKGLMIAVVLHAFFNLFLQFNQLAFALGIVIVGYYFLNNLLSQKSGRLILITDPDVKQASTMAKSDEEVVIELLAMWFKQKRYVDVIHICERLLKRDPDNKVVQLFKAQATDKLENNTYGQILMKLFPSKKTRSLDDLSQQK